MTLSNLIHVLLDAVQLVPLQARRRRACAAGETVICLTGYGSMRFFSVCEGVLLLVAVHATMCVSGHSLVCGGGRGVCGYRGRG